MEAVLKGKYRQTHLKLTDLNRYFPVDELNLLFEYENTDFSFAVTKPVSDRITALRESEDFTLPKIPENRIFIQGETIPENILNIVVLPTLNPFYVYLEMCQGEPENLTGYLYGFPDTDAFKLMGAVKRVQSEKRNR